MMVMCVSRRTKINMAIAAVTYSATAVVCGMQGRQLNAVLAPCLQRGGEHTAQAG
jgi:hypothetical protein